MGTVRKYIDTLKDDVVMVLQKPFLILSIIVIGFFMVWFSSEQVRTVLRFLVHLEALDERQATRFTRKYLFFGLSLLAVLWLDLLLINTLYYRAKTAYSFLQKYLSQSRNGGLLGSDENKLPAKRRYALRSNCRRDA